MRGLCVLEEYQYDPAAGWKDQRAVNESPGQIHANGEAMIQTTW